jgi:hypothetical protein
MRDDNGKPSRRESEWPRYALPWALVVVAISLLVLSNTTRGRAWVAELIAGRRAVAPRVPLGRVLHHDRRGADVDSEELLR